MASVEEKIRATMDTLFETIDSLESDLEDSREELREATREHNARAGRLIRDADKLRAEAGEWKRALRATEEQNIGNGSDDSIGDNA